MAKGQDRFQERKNRVASFGRELVRRSGSRCELCSASGVRLEVFEVAPVPEEPDIEGCVMLCETCRDQVETPNRRDPDHWRCLDNSIWSETRAVKVLSVMLLRSNAVPEGRAHDLLEQVYLDPDEEEWIEHGLRSFQ